MAKRTMQEQCRFKDSPHQHGTDADGGVKCGAKGGSIVGANRCLSTLFSTYLSTLFSTSVKRKSHFFDPVLAHVLAHEICASTGSAAE